MKLVARFALLVPGGFSSIRCHGSAKRAVMTRKLEFKGKNSEVSLDVHMSSY